MRLFGFEFTRAKKPEPERTALAETKSFGGSPPMSPGGMGWWPMIRESASGAWQRGIVERPENVLNFHAVYSCVTLIASDIGKLRIKLVEQDANGIWNETATPAFSPILRKPNSYQNRIKFLEQWVTSKLLHGNAYVLKERDNRGVVVGLSVLDPTRCKPMVTPSGDVYYQLRADWLANVSEDASVVPASEIIHDIMNALYHPLVGVSPIYACGLAASQGLHIQRNSSSFFANGARPSGVLTAPGTIPDDVAKRLKDHWEANYTGENSGRVAVLGSGLVYNAMTMTAVDSQLIDQLKMTAEMVCSTFKVPPFMVGLAELPARVSVEAFNQQYYTQCLQILIESIELCLDEGLGLVNVPGHTYGTELDLDGLLRMDQAAQLKALGDAIGQTLMAPNEARKKMDLPPKEGGDSLFIQEQNYSVSAIAKRDALDNPFGAKSPAAPKQADPAPVANDNAGKELGSLVARAIWLSNPSQPDAFAAFQAGLMNGQELHAHAF